MPTPSKTLIALENRFWQSLLDQDADAALELLNEPSVMVSSHGAMKFDHAAYRQMAEKGAMVLKKFELSDMEVVFPNDTTALITYHVTQTMVPRGKSAASTQKMNDTSTWVKAGDEWKCVMHTETAAGSQ